MANLLLEILYCAYATFNVALVPGRKADTDMLVSGNMGECMVVVYMKSMSEQHL